ncbi:hypothetical protein E2C01_046618 [Portunus trituberculatus]|uniref:Uncharacterized protein n=1 Tax=Portunus trituberculatus TaxID=210409 RepID=A0A5B7G1G4_PORTR|nr:hypothetical protein [Portunus trituberculatus]
MMPPFHLPTKLNGILTSYLSISLSCYFPLSKLKGNETTIRRTALPRTPRTSARNIQTWSSVVTHVLRPARCSLMAVVVPFVLGHLPVTSRCHSLNLHSRLMPHSPPMNTSREERRGTIEPHRAGRQTLRRDMESTLAVLIAPSFAARQHCGAAKVSPHVT